jgi:hypothetical protein
MLDCAASNRESGRSRLFSSFLPLPNATIGKRPVVREKFASLGKGQCVFGATLPIRETGVNSRAKKTGGDGENSKVVQSRDTKTESFGSGFISWRYPPDVELPGAIWTFLSDVLS